MPQPEHGTPRSKRRGPGLRTGLLLVGVAFAAFTLLPAAHGLRHTLHVARGAHPQWLVVAVLATAVGLVASALQLIGSTTLQLSLIRTTRVQLAAAFADVAAPASLGRLGVDARYLRQSGLDASAAAASVAVDALAGFVGHVLVLVVTAVLAGAAPANSFHRLGRWLWVALAAVVLLGAVVAILLPRQRWRQIVDSVASAIVTAQETVRRPDKLAERLGGATAVTVLQIVALVACVRAFAVDLGFAAIALVYRVGGGVASLAPTPGSVGAVEAALVGGLVSAGVSADRAVAAVLMFRLVTFWAPLPPGAIAFFDLRRHATL